MKLNEFIKKPSLFKIIETIQNGSHTPNDVMLNSRLSYATIFSGIKTLKQIGIIKTYKDKRRNELYLSDTGARIYKHYIKIGLLL